MPAPPIVIGGYAAFESLLVWLGLATVTAATAVVIVENMNEANKAAGSSQSGTTSYADACSSCMPPEDEEEETDKKPELESNPKHHPHSKSPEPSNVRELYRNSVPDRSGVRWAKDSNGVVHRFSRPSNGKTHWNGSTEGSDPIQARNIPSEIKRQLGVRGLHVHR